MWEQVGIVRRTRGLRNACEEISELIADSSVTDEFYVAGAESANMLESGRLIANAALNRTVNVGLHYNADLGPPWEASKRPTQAQV